MTQFTVKKINNAKYACIVFCNSFKSPTCWLDLINDELRMLNIRGSVVFDLILVNGNGNRRYAKAEFDGHNLDIAKMQTVAADPEISAASYDYFHNNPHLLDNSILSKATKFMIKMKLAA